MRAIYRLPCRIDRRVPSRDRNSGGGLGSFPLISGCNARCLTLIFHPSDPAPTRRPPLSLSISALDVVAPSRSPLSRRGLSCSTVPLSPLPSPLLSYSGPAFLLYLLRISLFLPFGTRPSGDQFGATGRNVSRPGEIQRHTRTVYLSYPSSRGVFNRLQGACLKIAVDFDVLHVTKLYNEMEMCESRIFDIKPD